MRLREAPVVSEGFPLDDMTLMQRYKRLCEDIAKRECTFINVRGQEQKYENDYLSVAMARLAYGFAKEEYNNVFEELEKRGLITR